MFTVRTWGGGDFFYHHRTPGLLVIVALQPIVLVLGIYLAGMFEHPATSVAVVGRLVRSVVDLARSIEYAVQVDEPSLFRLNGFFH